MAENLNTDDTGFVFPERDEHLKQRKGNGKIAADNAIGLMDFYAYSPTHQYIFIPTGEMWAAASINARIRPVQLGKGEDGKSKTLAPATWLDQNRPVEQMTWAPGEPALIEDKLIDKDWFFHAGARVYNLYRPPTSTKGDSSKEASAPWLDHIRAIYPDDADHIVNWSASRVQHPADKINHNLILGGDPGIGKDTIIEPLKRAVGPWNCQEVSPQTVMKGDYTGYLQAVILRVSEAHDVGDYDRFKLFERMKTMSASPPETHRINEKYIPAYYIPNCVGIIVTSNHKDALYLPPDDRRHYVSWSKATIADFTEDYWKKLWAWINSGGDQNVAAYLAALDITKFNITAPPPKTPAFWEIVSINQAPEDAELADVLDAIGNPLAITLETIKAGAPETLSLWLNDRKNRRVVPHRLEKCGYVSVRNEDAKDGLWKVHGKRQVVYCQKSLPLSAQLAAADALAKSKVEATKVETITAADQRKRFYERV